MTRIDPDSMRLVLRCGYEAWHDGYKIYWKAEGGSELLTFVGALSACREKREG